MCATKAKCDQVKALPLKFTIGSNDPKDTVSPREFEIPATTYLIQGEYLGLPPEFCVIGVTGFVPEEQKKFVFGNLFLKHFYSIFDAEQQRIGFAFNLKTAP